MILLCFFLNDHKIISENGIFHLFYLLLAKCRYSKYLCINVSIHKSILWIKSIVTRCSCQVANNFNQFDWNIFCFIIPEFCWNITTSVFPIGAWSTVEHSVASKWSVVEQIKETLVFNCNGTVKLASVADLSVIVEMCRNFLKKIVGYRNDKWHVQVWSFQHSRHKQRC